MSQEKDVVFNQSIDLRIQDLKSEQYLLDDKLDDNNTAHNMCLVIYKF